MLRLHSFIQILDTYTNNISRTITDAKNYHATARICKGKNRFQTLLECMKIKDRLEFKISGLSRIDPP